METRASGELENWKTSLENTKFQVNSKPKNEKKMDLKLIIGPLFSLCILVCCTGQGQAISTQQPEPTIIGNYLDTTLFEGRRLRIDYCLDSSILISVTDGSKQHPLKLAPSQLPKWFNPLGFKIDMDFAVMTKNGEVIPYAKFFVVNDSILVFPIINTENEGDLCIIKIDKHGIPRLVIDDVPLPTQLLIPKPHMRTYFSEKHMQVAYSEFYPTRQSVTWCTLVAFEFSNPYIIGTKGIPVEDCPVNTFIDDTVYINWLRCMYSNIFNP